jgi:vancomycin resistance protein YoaR
MNTTIRQAPGLPAKSRRMLRGDFWTLEHVNLISRSVFVAVALCVLATIAGLTLYGYSHSDRIYEGVKINGIAAGGMTESEARAALDAQFDSYLDTPITLEGNGKTFTITPREVGVTFDSSATVETAYEFGRTVPLWSRGQSWVRSTIRGHEFNATVSVDTALLEAKLASFAPEVTRAPADARVDMTADGSPSIVPEVAGVALDVGGTRNNLIEHFSNFSTSKVEMVTPSVAPSVTAAQLESSLPQAKTVVSEAFVMAGHDKSWIVSSDDLKRIVYVNGTDGSLQVDERSLRALIRNIAGEIEQEPADAGIYVTETGEFAVAPSKNAVDLDVNASLADAMQALKSGNHSTNLKIAVQEPAITDAMAQQAILTGEDLVKNGMAVNWDAGSAQLGRDDLLAALVIQPRPGEDQPFVFSFDKEVLESRLQPIIDQIYVPAVDATFRLVDGRVTVIEDAQTGQEVDIENAVDRITNAAFNHETSITLKVRKVKPTYPASTRPNIELSDLLGDSATYYGTSSEPRRHNVEHAVGLENGWLVPPDGIFSYDEFLGEVTKDAGFVTGFGIVADGNDGAVTTAPVVGGGICQVSTTIFQAAFWAGMPIVERWQHPYWLTTYGDPPRGMKGLDAMVNIEDDWSLDMKFQNTTGDWIAVVVTADGEYVRAEVWGTNPGWEVEVTGPEITNIVDPGTDMRYTDSPELPAGQELQVEHAQEGFDASIHRVVTKDGEVIDDYTLESSFAPSQNTTLRGTGTGV